MIRDSGMPRERRKCLMSLAVSAAATSLPRADRCDDRQHRRGAPVVAVEETVERNAMRVRHAAIARGDRQVDHLFLLGDHDRMVGAVVVGNRADRDAVALGKRAAGEQRYRERCEKRHQRSANPRGAIERRHAGDIGF